MDCTPGKLLTLTKSTRQHHHKSRGGDPCTAISGSLGAMIQGWFKVEGHPAKQGNHVTQFTEDQSALHSQLTIHTWVLVAHWLLHQVLVLKHLSSDCHFSDHTLRCEQDSAEHSSFTNTSPKAQTFDIKKHKSHNVRILLFIFLYILGSMHLPINSYLGEEHSHEIDIAGEMSTIPLVPKLKTAEKSNI